MLYIPVPKIFTMFSSLLMASLALPGMSGFVAEVIVAPSPVSAYVYYTTFGHHRFSHAPLIDGFHVYHASYKLYAFVYCII